MCAVCLAQSPKCNPSWLACHTHHMSMCRVDVLPPLAPLSSACVIANCGWTTDGLVAERSRGSEPPDSSSGPAAAWHGGACSTPPRTDAPAGSRAHCVTTPRHLVNSSGRACSCSAAPLASLRNWLAAPSHTATPSLA
jgi:hypothetical protein